MAEKIERRARGVIFKTGLEGLPDKDIEITAYVFNRRNELLASAPLKDDSVHFDLNGKELAKARIFFGPPLKERVERKPTIERLERLHAYEPVFVFDPQKYVYELPHIPEIDWRYWVFCSCKVRGKVVKPVTVNGVTTDMPVCHARVHICDVDPIWLLLRRLPDDIIERIRGYLLVEPPFPPPPPEADMQPVFQFDPSEMNVNPVNIARMNQSLGGRAAIGAGMSARSEASPKPLSASLSAATLAGLLSPSISIVRDTLLAHPDLIRPFICWWPWIWPYFYRCDELVVLETGPNGRFETTIWYSCVGDHPDLYFWVEFCIGGVWTTVYRPPIRCHTYWNYACGSDVMIRIYDPRVPWCGDPPTLPGKQIAVMLVGNNISLHQIQGAAAGSDEGLTISGRPFGGSLEPHVWFGQDDLIAAGITHYRWSYRSLEAAGDPWHAMDRQVIRHYAVIEPTPPHHLTFKPFLLGPDPAFPHQNLFKIQPTDAPPGSFGWAPMIDGRENTASAFFLSHLLNGGDAAAAAGRYELKLELFKNTGALANLTDNGVAVKIPTIDGPFGAGSVPTIDAPNEYLIKDGAGKTIGFRMVLHVDNNPCEAEIYETSVGASSAGPCGFINYPAGADAHISFKARHPNNYATFDFGVYRGSIGEIIDVSGSVAAGPINGFSRSAASVYSRDIPVASLVGPCPGGAAAFAETLHVDAMATDGWSATLDYLDKDAVPKAFALKPAGP